ncbi:MAG: protein disulfide oxidoreductase [Gammaproteobacteria bacterium]|nr:MAG: protein disulfide oxidoreductase [Gammaproteobacteria bacterium]
MKKFIRQNSFWFLMIVLFFGAQFFVKRDLVSGAPPLIQAFTVTGAPFELKQLEGEPALLYFWASWCGICDAMDEGIESLSADYAVITVAMQSGGREEVITHLQEKGLSFPVIADASGEISKSYGLHAVPAFFVLTPSGEIAFSGMGYTTSWGLRLRLWLVEKGFL